MATRIEIKKILKDLNLTEAEMEDLWKDLASTNKLVENLQAQNISWKELNDSVIRQIPTQKKKDLESIKKKNEEAEQKRIYEQKIKEEKEYYANHFEEIMLNKIVAGTRLSTRELSDILEYEIESEREYGENRRWSRSVSSIIKLLDRYFYLNWEEGLTEMQENKFYDQPYEVKKHTYEKTIIVTEWREKD